jgi:hypothetical protein
MWTWLVSVVGGVWGWLGKWLAILGGAVLAIGAAVLYGRSKGKAEVEQKQAAQHGEDIAKAAETRNEVEQGIQKLPEKPQARVGDADPDSAAGVLRDDGWTRD